MGPYRQWPTGMGFDYFYGFLGGETNQWYPALYEGTTPVEPCGHAGGGLLLQRRPVRSRDQVDPPAEGADARQAVLRVLRARARRTRRTTSPTSGRTSTRASSTTAGTRCASETFARQKELGVIPPDCDLTERSAGIPAWDDIADELKPVLARQMEIYAGYLENTDHHVGLLLDALEDLKLLDDTLIYVIIGDNGASAEGSLQGTFNEMITLGGFGALETAEFMSSRIDEFGGPEAYNHYAVGWAHAMDTPYQWTKQVASHWGGTRNGTIVHWPRRHRREGRGARAVPPRDRRRADGARGGRPAAADLRQRRPAEADGGRLDGLLVRRRARGGAARDAVLRDVREPRHLPQGLDRGHRSTARRGRPGRTRRSPAFDDDVWELYDTTTDWTQAHDLAAEHPEKLAELQRLWLIEAVKYNVVPLDDRFVERGLPEIGRPPDADPGQQAAAVRRHGPADRELRADDEEHVVLAHRAGRRCRSRAPRA